jgi:hypothetical protein
MNKADLLSQDGLPGKGIEMASGLQKPFNSTSESVGIKNFLNGFQELIKVYFGEQTRIETTSR